MKEITYNINYHSIEAIVIVSPISGTINFTDIRTTVYPKPAYNEIFVKITDFSIYNSLQASIYDFNRRLVK